MAFSARAVFYVFLNVAVAVGIVFTNKAIFAVYDFRFPVALTWVHLMFTVFGMRLLSQAGFFEARRLPSREVVDLAAAYVGYVVLGNLSLKMNTVGFYQITKILISPAVMLIDIATTRVIPETRTILAVALLSLGITFATVTDAQVMSNVPGMLVGFGSVLATALYNIWAGSKQKKLGVGSSQLVHQFSPLASVMLAVLVPILEPVGATDPAPGTLLGFSWSLPCAVAILASAVLGLLVALSTFLVIGSTSALTYNVMGHMKTIFILLGGMALYGDEMPPKKVAGLVVAAVGIAWYTAIKMGQKPERPRPPAVSAGPSYAPFAHGGSNGGGKFEAADPLLKRSASSLMGSESCSSSMHARSVSETAYSNRSSAGEV